MRLRRFVFVALFINLIGMVAFAQSSPALFNVKKVYVEKMDNNLDQYIPPEISRQFHGSLAVVLEPGQADGIIKGVNVGAQNTTKATVELVDPSGTHVLCLSTASTPKQLF